MSNHLFTRDDSISNRVWKALRTRFRGQTVRRNRRRAVEVETLEIRELLAGDVTVAVSGGKLKINGDGRDNGVELTAGSTKGEFVVRGVAQDGKPTTVNGKESVTVRNVTKKVKFDMSGGDDYVSIHSTGNLILPQLLQVYGGLGNDRVSFSTLNGRIKVLDEVIFDLAAGDDAVSVRAEGTGQGIVTQKGLRAVMGAGQDTVSIDALGGTAQVKVKGDLQLQLDGGYDNALITSHDADARIQVNQNLLVNGGDYDDVVRLDALSDNATIVVRGESHLLTGQGNDRVRITASADQARVQLNGKVDISAASGEDSILLEALAGNAQIVLNNMLSAAGGGDGDFIRVQAVDDSASVSIAGAATLDTGGTDVVNGDRIAIRAMNDNASVTFHNHATLRNNNALRVDDAVVLRADADNAKIHFRRNLAVELGVHERQVNVELLARTGNAAILVDGNLSITSDAGETSILIEARFDNTAVHIAGNATITTDRLNDELKLLSGDGTLTVGGNLTAHLGDKRDRLEVTGLSVTGSALFDAQEDVDTLVDGGNNTFGAVEFRNFEV